MMFVFDLRSFIHFIYLNIFQQSDIQQLERTRESMARELVNLTNQNESLEEKVQELPELKEQYQVIYGINVHVITIKMYFLDLTKK